jgi:hypothetical protein
MVEAVTVDVAAKATAALDQAQAALDQDGDGKLGLSDVKIAASKAKQQVEAAMAIAKEKGFFSHFKEYNTAIIRPFMNAGELSMNTAKDEILATLKLSPASPLVGFVFYNTLALVLGVCESLIAAFLGGGWISLIWNGAVSYAVAYTLYWLITCSGDTKLMRYALLFILLYVAFNVWMAVSTLIFVIPAVLYGAKAFINLLQLLNGYTLLKEIIGDANVFSMV